MKIGDYVRNEYGIAKVINIKNENGIDVLEFDNSICYLVNLKTGEIKGEKIRYLPLTNNIDVDKIKHSRNIMDLIEVGDYVNGYMVKAKDEKENKVYFDYLKKSYPANIETVLTKEQFESMKYEVKKHNTSK